MSRAGGLLLALLLAAVQASADLASTPPEQLPYALAPVADADVSGAEPLMQQAMGTAREQLNALLAQAEPDADALAEAYGRLGALFLLVEVEAQADACLRNAMQLQPQAFRWPYYAGYLAMLAGNLDEAVAYLEQARGIDPDYPALYVRLGKVRLDRSDLKEARAAFERVKDDPALASPAHYYLGQIAILERRNADAIVLLQQAIAANPDATEVYYPLAQAHRALGERDKAREALDRFKLRSPEIADPLIAELQAATQRSLPAFTRAIHAVREGDYTTAVDEFAAGLAVDPDNAAARVSYARVLYLAGRQDDAAAELGRALALDPEHVLGNFLTGVLRQQQGDREGAADAYRRTLALEPGHSGALFYLASLDFAAGRFDAAAEGYRRVAETDATIAPARLLAPIAAAHTGKQPEAAAVENLSRLVEVHPDDPQLRYALVRLLAAADDPAVRDPERALALATDLVLRQPIPPYQRALALAQAAAGRFDEAAQSQQQLTAIAWMAPPAERALMDRELAAYRERQLPRPALPADDPLLGPPPFDPLRPFRDYPATTPY